MKKVPEVLFFHGDYRKVVKEIEVERSFWRVFVSLLVIFFGGGFLLGGGKSFVPLFAGAAVFTIAVLVRCWVDIDPAKKDLTFDFRDILGVGIPGDHMRFSRVRRLVLEALKPLRIGDEIFVSYWETFDKISTVLTDRAMEIIRLERAGVGKEPACVERRNDFHTIIEGLAAQGERCLLPLGVKNPRRYYFEAAEERLAKK